MPHRIRSEIISDPTIRGGEPVIRGTRVPAYLIAWMVSEGVPQRDILHHYPSLNLSDIDVAVEFAKLHPERAQEH